MINEISYTSDSKSNEGMRLSYGEYSTTSKVMKIWVYHTRMERVMDGTIEKDRIVKVRELESKEYKEYLKNAETIELVDLDWDKHWVMPKKQFKASKVEDGYRKFKLSELKLIS